MDAREPSAGREPEPDLPDRLRRDLKALYAARPDIPADIDETILARARRARPVVAPRRRSAWWTGAGVAAAAILAVSLWWGFFETERPDAPGGELAHRGPEAAPWEDVDRSGRVDILDAYWLARRLASAGALDVRYDVNGDGRVDRSDVDTLAHAAVRVQ